MCISMRNFKQVKFHITMFGKKKIVNTRQNTMNLETEHFLREGERDNFLVIL